MERLVSFVSRLVFARQPDKSDKIVVSVLLIVSSKEEDGGDDGSDLYQVGFSLLAIFYLRDFWCRFEERGKIFRRHCVGAGLLALL